MAQLVDPITGTLLLLLLALVLLARGRRVGCGLFLVLGILWTYALATPAVADVLLRSLERRIPPVVMHEIPAADAIVVLGGGVRPTVAPRLGPDLNQTADRILYGARLYHADKAPVIIVTGSRPYPNPGPTAAEAQAQILGELGVPQDAIVAPGDSTSTATDARVVHRVLRRRELDKVLLVTSALHMPRALATFQAQGVSAFPAPTDIEATQVQPEKQWASGSSELLAHCYMEA